MDLLSLLLGGLTSSNSVKATSKKTGLSSQLTSKLLIAAIPLLIKYMTQNASKKEGAQSLANALTQHQTTAKVPAQIKNADIVDGAKIIGHILGNDQSNVINNLSQQTGASTTEVNSLLSTIAPALLSSLATATNSANQKTSGKVDLSDGIDLSDVMGILGGSGSNSMLGSLLGTSNKKNDGTQLLSALLSAMK